MRPIRIMQQDGIYYAEIKGLLWGWNQLTDCELDPTCPGDATDAVVYTTDCLSTIRSLVEMYIKQHTPSTSDAEVVLYFGERE